MIHPGSTAVTSQPAPLPRVCPLPELLAPAGDWECARAAVENGADAIYFGLEKFNARMRAQNFTEADLPGLMEFLHRRGVKGYVAFNILVFENELAEAEQFLRNIIAAGVDAAIVQDVGLCRLIRALSDDFPIHASTQMTITSAGGVDFARELGCNLVVLARECSLKEIEQIERAGGAGRQLPLEVFVHGALCVAYSGQCLTSEALGGRSANRGECAQACRLPYELVADGQPVPLGDRRYLLSPQDLAGLEVLPELVRLGVASLKIEGRLKSPEYVASITRIYRNALDQIAAQGGSGFAAPAGDRYEMEMAFSRGLYTGWFGGTNNQQLVHGRFGKKRGVFLGEITAVHRDGVTAALQGPLKPGDGVVFDAGKPEEPEEGGRVYEIKPAREGRGRRLTFGRGDVNLGRVHVGDRLWKTSDPELERRLRQSFAGDAPRYQRPVTIEVQGRAGSPLSVRFRDETGCEACVDSSLALEPAQRQPLTTERLREQLGRLGGTPFRLAHLENRLEGEVMLPLSELNRLRRDGVAQLEALRARPLRWSLRPVSGLENLEAGGPYGREAGPAASEVCLRVLVRDLPQLEAALAAGVRHLYCEFEDLKKYREAVSRFRAATAGRPGAEIFVAPPRVFKTGEEWTLNQVRSSGADGYLVRNYDHLRFFAADRRVGDYSLNIANRLSAAWFMERFGLERVTASYDLNVGQLEALLQGAPPAWFEVTIHQHIPMFHMEHCVFCAFLSQGVDYRDCGRPCDRHELKLRDRVGAEHPVKADAGCRNTVFNAVAQTGAEFVPRLLDLGVQHFRLEFLTEPPARVRETIERYQDLLSGRITGVQLWRELRLLNQLGVTRGQMAGAMSR
jgi:putative protease